MPAPGLRWAQASVAAALHIHVPTCFLSPALTPRALSTHLHANLHLGSCFQGTRHKREPLFQNCCEPCTSTLLWVPLAVWGHWGTPVPLGGCIQRKERVKAIVIPCGAGGLRISRLEMFSCFLAVPPRAWQPSPSGSSFLLQTGILPSVMYPHFLSPFLRGAVFLPRKKVKREQRHMVFLSRLTPTFKENRGKHSN